MSVRLAPSLMAPAAEMERVPDVMEILEVDWRVFAAVALRVPLTIVVVPVKVLPVLEIVKLVLLLTMRFPEPVSARDSVWEAPEL